METLAGKLPTSFEGSAVELGEPCGKAFAFVYYPLSLPSLNQSNSRVGPLQRKATRAGSSLPGFPAHSSSGAAGDLSTFC